MILKGDIFIAELGEEGVGSEQLGTRPCVVVSNNIGNKFSPCVIVALVTSKTDKPNLPTHLELTEGSFGLNKRSVIMCEQLRTIDKIRLKKQIGKLSEGVLAQLDFALMTALQII